MIYGKHVGTAMIQKTKNHVDAPDGECLKHLLLQVFYFHLGDQVKRLKSAKNDGVSKAGILHHLGWKKSQTTTWDVWNPIDTGINYQPQLVQDFFHQQYYSFWCQFQVNLLKNFGRVDKNTQQLIKNYEIS